MITKDDGTSRNSFEHYGTESYGEDSQRPFSTDDSPPTYDDPNYIPSPVSMSGGGVNMTTYMPLVVPQATSALGGSSSVVNTNATTHSTSLTYPSSSSSSSDWTHTLHELEHTMSKLQAARTRASASAQPKQSSSSSSSSAREVRALEGRVLGCMRRLALVHPDVRVREVWNARAEVFLCGMSGYRGRLLGEGEGEGFAGSAMGDGDGRVYREESYADSDADFIIDQQRPSKSNKRSLSSLSTLSTLSTSTLGSKAKHLLTSDDKGLSYITKGTAGVVIAPIAMSGALLYGTAALLYGAGKGVVYLGRKAVGGAAAAAAMAAAARDGSSSSRKGADADVGAGVGVGAGGADLRSTSNPELVSPSHARSTAKGDVRHNRDF